MRNIGRDETSNAGLWLERYMRRSKQAEYTRQQEREKEQDDPARSEIIEEVARTSAPPGYRAAFEARMAALSSFDAGFVGGVTKLLDATAAGRFIVGLGIQTPLEIGITLSRTWGMPYLPGSSLKGLAAAVAHARTTAEATAWKKADPAGKKGAAHEILFGSEDQAGCVVFHDAWWDPTSKLLPLHADVMTVHHREYYGGQSDTVTGTLKPPSDMDEPNPVPFLTATGKYQVAVSGPEEWVNVAMDLLHEGLTHEGLGAKTAAGYGRFVVPETTAQGARRLQREAEAARAKDEADEELRAMRAAQDEAKRLAAAQAAETDRARHAALAASAAERLASDDPVLAPIRRIIERFNARNTDDSMKKLLNLSGTLDDAVLTEALRMMLRKDGAVQLRRWKDASRMREYARLVDLLGRALQ